MRNAIVLAHHDMREPDGRAHDEAGRRAKRLKKRLDLLERDLDDLVGDWIVAPGECQAPRPNADCWRRLQVLGRRLERHLQQYRRLVASPRDELDRAR